MITKYKYLSFIFISLVFFFFSQLCLFLIDKSDFFIYENKKIIFFFSPPYLLVLIILAILAFVIFSLWEIKKEANQLKIIALAMILGGGFSNFLDRIIRGGVADYLNIYFWQMNLADLLIIFGLILFSVSIIRAGRCVKR